MPPSNCEKGKLISESKWDILAINNPKQQKHTYSERVYKDDQGTDETGTMWCVKISKNTANIEYRAFY